MCLFEKYYILCVIILQPCCHCQNRIFNLGCNICLSNPLVARSAKMGAIQEPVSVIVKAGHLGTLQGFIKNCHIKPWAVIAQQHQQISSVDSAGGFLLLASAHLLAFYLFVLTFRLRRRIQECYKLSKANKLSSPSVVNGSFLVPASIKLCRGAITGQRGNW